MSNNSRNRACHIQVRGNSWTVKYSRSDDANYNAEGTCLSKVCHATETLYLSWWHCV